MTGNRARIAIIDHGAGNLVSVANALRAVGADVTVTTHAADLTKADGVVLPGVGHTGAAMRNLRAEGLIDPIRGLTQPLLGICVGFQVFLETSDEDDEPCLGMFAGRVERLRGAPTLPHMGWNPVTFTVADPIFAGLDDSTPFYFVHSFAPVPTDPLLTIATAEHGSTFCAAARRANVVGTQFHPERSGRAGLAVLSNWVRSVCLEETTPQRMEVG